MATNPAACYPSWHPTFAPLRGTAADNLVASGCKINGDGNVACAPESMRAAAEQKVRASGFWPLDRPLTLATYALGRNIQSEVGSGTVEERVALAESTFNRGKRTPEGVINVLLYRQPVGHKNRGFFGPIHGGTIKTAPYGRWSATSKDPSVLSLLLADFVLSGKSGDFARRADDQDGPEHWVGDGQTRLDGYVRYLASNGKYWVGPLPGVDHWKTFLQFTPGIKSTSPDGQALLARGLAALKLPLVRPSWPANMPVCASTSSTASSSPSSSDTGRKLAVGAVVFGGLGGLAFLAWRMASSIRTATFGRELSFDDDDDDYDDDDGDDEVPQKALAAGHTDEDVTP